MKKAQIVLNFSHNTIALKGHQIKLSMTSNGPNCLPITEPKLLINNIIETGNQDQINLRVTVLKRNSEIAYTLHWSFARLSVDKLLKQEVNGQITKSCKMKSKISLKNAKPVKSATNHLNVQLYLYLWQESVFIHRPQNILWAKHLPLDWSMYPPIYCNIYSR